MKRSVNPLGPIAHAACLCGHTLTIASAGLPKAQLVELIEWAKADSLRRSIGMTELLRQLRDRIDREALRDDEYSSLRSRRLTDLDLPRGERAQRPATKRSQPIGRRAAASHVTGPELRQTTGTEHPLPGASAPAILDPKAVLSPPCGVRHIFAIQPGRRVPRGPLAPNAFSEIPISNCGLSARRYPRRRSNETDLRRRWPRGSRSW